MTLIPPDKRNGAASRDVLISTPASKDEMAAPIDRAMVVTPDAAERSSGSTTAIVYDWRVGTSTGSTPKRT